MAVAMTMGCSAEALLRELTRSGFASNVAAELDFVAFGLLRHIVTRINTPEYDPQRYDRACREKTVRPNTHQIFAYDEQHQTYLPTAESFEPSEGYRLPLDTALAAGKTWAITVQVQAPEVEDGRYGHKEVRKSLAEFVTATLPIFVDQGYLHTGGRLFWQDGMKVLYEDHAVALFNGFRGKNRNSETWLERIVKQAEVA